MWVKTIKENTVLKRYLRANNIFAQIIEQAEECQKKVSDVTLSQDIQNEAIKSLFILTDDLHWILQWYLFWKTSKLWVIITIID